MSSPFIVAYEFGVFEWSMRTKIVWQLDASSFMIERKVRKLIKLEWPVPDYVRPNTQKTKQPNDTEEDEKKNGIRSTVCFYNHRRCVRDDNNSHM